MRPANLPNGYGEVLVSKDGWLVGLRFDNQMYLAYNVNSRTAYAGPRLYTLSPFLVIDNSIEMNKLDVDQVLNAGIGSGAGQSRLKPILAELRSTNPAIASLAQTMAYNNATVVRTNE